MTPFFIPSALFLFFLIDLSLIHGALSGSSGERLLWSASCESATVVNEETLLWLKLFALDVRSGGVIILSPSRTQLFLPWNVAILRMALPGLVEAGPRVKRLSVDPDRKLFSFSNWKMVICGLVVFGCWTWWSVSPDLLPESSVALEYPSSSLSTVVFVLATLTERLLKLLVILATLSLRIIECAEVRTKYSLRARLVIPGKGRISFVQTSARIFSSLIRSARAGARTGIRFVVSRDCDLLMAVYDDPSLQAFVFFMITWQRLVGPTVVARCIDILRAIVPNSCQSLKKPTWLPGVITRLSKNRTKWFDLQRQWGKHWLLSYFVSLFVRMIVKAASPFKLFFGRTRAHCDFIKLMVTLEYQLPRKWSSMTLHPYDTQSVSKNILKKNSTETYLFHYRHPRLANC